MPLVSKFEEGECRRTVDMTHVAGGLVGGTLALGLPEFNKKRERLAVKVAGILQLNFTLFLKRLHLPPFIWEG